MGLQGAAPHEGTAFSPPVIPRRPTVHEAHGVRRLDDYAWLRDVDNPEVLDYLRAERDHYDAATAHLAALRSELVAEMEARTPAMHTSVPWRRAGRSWATRVQPGEEYEQLLLVDADGAADEVALDPNQLDRGPDASPPAHLDLGLVEPSPDGRLLAYSVDRTGREVYELRFRDLERGADLPDRVGRTYYGGAWSSDSTAFYYTVHDEQNRPDRVARHLLGTDPESDVVVVTEPDRRFELDVAASRDGRWVVVVAASRDTTEVRLLDAADPDAPARVVAARRPGIEYAVEPLPGGWYGHGDDRLLVVTNDGAAEFTLVESPLPDAGGTGDPAGWVPVPAAVSRHTVERLVRAAVLDGHVLLAVRRDAEPFLRVMSRAVAPGSTPAREIHPHLPCGQLRTYHLDDPHTRQVVVVEENLVTAPVYARVDLDTGERTVLHRTPVPGMDPTRYVTERIWATASDGVRVPVTLARLRNALPRATNGALLYGYGAYESCEWPEFSVATLSLLDRDVCYAVAHVRGGGELGRRWWLQGRLRAKATTFDDFVAARDGLVESGWAVSSEIVSRGLSAGGLLQAAAWTRAPDRWRGVVAEVPFVDVVTSMSDDSVPLTVLERGEWGDPADPDDFAAMLAYSPYDNVPPPPRPPLLVTGALHDPRVLVHEPAKWVARIRATDSADAPSDVLFRPELGEGAHAGPAGRLARMRYEGEVLAWVLDRLGLKARER
jgi:oligopeptidase B